jgi:ribosomal-protein-alanine N-acetyltransferase
MTVKISLANLEDAAAIAEMSRSLIEAGLPWSWNERRVAHHVRHPDSAVIVARDRQRVVGFAIMEFLDEHAHLSLLAVRPGYRQQGIGSELVQWLQSSARTAGIFDIRLELRAQNRAAQRFYERLGYTIAGSRPRYYAGVEDALCMARDLSVVSAPRA